MNDTFPLILEIKTDVEQLKAEFLHRKEQIKNRVQEKKENVTGTQETASQYAQIAKSVPYLHVFLQDVSRIGLLRQCQEWLTRLTNG